MRHSHSLHVARLAIGLAVGVSGLAALAACGIEASPPEPSANGGTPTGQTDAGTAKAVAPNNGAPSSTGAPLLPAPPTPSGGGAPSPTTSLPPGCGVSEICLEVSPIKAGTTPPVGRVMVVWKQLAEDGPDPAPEVGYAATFTGAEKYVVIPIAQITPPTERNLLCARACKDESLCPCTGEPRVGTGYVFVYYDENQDGQIALDYASSLSEPVVGVGAMLIAFSDKAFPTPPQKPGYWKNVFPSGIEQGTRPYSLVNANSYQRFGAGVAQGTVFPLKTCDSAALDQCKPPIPNPM